MKRWILLLLVACDYPHTVRTGVARPVRTVADNATFDLVLEHSIVLHERHLDEKREELKTLEMVLAFVDCVERLGTRPFKIEYERGRHNETCRAQVLAMTDEQLHANNERHSRTP